MALPTRGLVLALDLIRAPVLAETMRRQPLLPSHEVLVLLRIAGGCSETSGKAASATGESPAFIREAVILYLEQVLLCPEADSYRVLGVSPDAPQETVREHLHWMMRWLHPDRNRNRWETVFAGRVLSAWENLKSPLRRREYDRQRTTNPVARPRIRGEGSTRRPGIPWIAAPLPQRRWRRPLLHLFALILLIGFVVWLASTGYLQLRSSAKTPHSSASEISSRHPSRDGTASERAETIPATRQSD